MATPTKESGNLSITDLIAKKRDGLELNSDEIKQFIDGLSNGDVQDCHVGAMLMAIYIKGNLKTPFSLFIHLMFRLGMTEQETCSMTRAMIDSGERLRWPEFRGTVVDKHSTGGVGDKISIPLAPALAACQLKVPMMSGRGLGITGGTLDKLESIPGYQTQLTDEQIVKLISTVGCGIFSQSVKLNPADRYLYSIRDVTATVPQNGLIVSSILSKKSIEDLDALVLDIKYGSSAFMKTFEHAEILADALFKVSEMLEMKTCCYITEMNNPIGFCIGNAIEIEESLDLMKYKPGHSIDLEELVCEQGK
jgi:pyrimidine-nucleoside phosphorylase